jgi:hypothetical protein
MSTYIKRKDNNLKIGTNNIDRIIISNDGNVGVNQSTPTYELDVSGYMKNEIFITNNLYLTNDYNDSVTFPKLWNQFGTNIFYNNGNVGIGVTNPSAKLEVGGNIYPSTTETYDLGTTTQRWRDLYLSGSSINLGGLDMSYDGSDLNISGGLNTTSNTDVKNFSINSGTQIIKMACGKYDFGGGSSGVNTATISFGTTFSNVNNIRVICECSAEPGSSSTNVFSTTVRSLTTTQFTLNVICIVFGSSTSWTQALDIHWMAYETN